MKLLFDESMPRPLGAYFPTSIEILTAICCAGKADLPDLPAAPGRRMDFAFAGSDRSPLPSGDSRQGKRIRAVRAVERNYGGR